MLLQARQFRRKHLLRLLDRNLARVRLAGKRLYIVGHRFGELGQLLGQISEPGAHCTQARPFNICEHAQRSDFQCNRSLTAAYDRQLAQQLRFPSHGLQNSVRGLHLLSQEVLGGCTQASYLGQNGSHTLILDAADNARRQI